MLDRIPPELLCSSTKAAKTNPYYPFNKVGVMKMLRLLSGLPMEKMTRQDIIAFRQAAIAST